LPQYHSRSEDETTSVAAEFARTLQKGDTLALFGGLGMGKTAFVRGLADGLGLDAEQVSSPTFALVHEYRGTDVTLCHFDMYRVSGEDDLHTTGFFDYLDGENILAIEWSEKIVDALPKNTITIQISPGNGESDRVIEIQPGEGKTRI